MLGSSTWIRLCFKDIEGPPRAVGPSVTMVKASSSKRWKPPGSTYPIHWPAASTEEFMLHPRFPASLTSNGPSLLLRAVISVELLDMRGVVRSARVGPPDYMAGRLTFRALRISC